MQQQINLYLDLKPGEKVNLEAAARAALAFDAALKEMAFAIDPFSTVQVELESGTKGSLSLNSIVRGVTGRISPLQLRAVATGIMVWFTMETASYTYEKVLDLIINEPEMGQSLSKEEAEQIANEVVKLLKGKIAEKEVGKVYQELQRDESIKGVGVSTEPAKRPRHIVPRSEFPIRGRIVTESAKDGTRSESSVQTLTLVSPVLMRGKRKWKFKQGAIEFGAGIRDEDFLDRVFSGREPVPMAEGITMKVKLTVKEDFKDGVWQTADRQIDEVLEINPAPVQGDLLRSSE